jgi:hypothetical protein
MPELYSAFLPEGSKLYCLMKKEKEIIYQWLYELSVNDFTGKIKYSDIAREIAGNFHGLSNVRIRDIITKARKIDKNNLGILDYSIFTPPMNNCSPESSNSAPKVSKKRHKKH